MIMRVLTFLLMAIWTSSCRAPDSNLDRDGIKKERLADTILKKTAAKLKHETELLPIGTSGQMLNDIQVLGLSFYYYKPVDILEGRQLLIKATNALMEGVNEEKRIYPYLSRYPFLPENIEIRIILRSTDGRDVNPGALWVVVASDGMLCYKVHDLQNNGLITIYKETYDEAVQRLSDPSLPLVPFQPDPELSQEELSRLRKGISLVSDDGAIWHLGANGSWTRDP